MQKKGNIHSMMIIQSLRFNTRASLQLKVKVAGSLIVSTKKSILSPTPSRFCDHPSVFATQAFRKTFVTSRRLSKELTPEQIEQWKKDMAKLENQHIHMRESETEQNDSYKLGSMLTRPDPHEHHGHTHARTEESDTLMTGLLDKKEIKKNAGVRITWIGLLVNVGLALGKFAGGIVFHSQALIADSVHALSDLISDFLTLFSVKLAKKPANQDYPFGYGKVETVGALAVSSILTFAGVSIGWSSLLLVCGPYLPQMILEFMHIHSHAHAIPADIGAAWIAGGSIVVKEWLFQATKKIAEKDNSNVLLANAWHHRVDSLTSLVALVTISGGYFFGISSLDAIGGLMVSGLVIKAGYSGMKSACEELVDKAIPKSDAKYINIESVIKDSLDKMVSNNNAKKSYFLKDLNVMAAGPNLHAHALLVVPLQRWENVLGINEFEIVTDHLRTVVYKNIPHVKQLHIEYIEEKPELSSDEKKEIERQKKIGTAPVPEAALKSTESAHSHTHFGGLFGEENNNKNDAHSHHHHH